MKKDKPKIKLPVWKLPPTGKSKIVAYIYVYEDGKVEIKTKGRDGKNYAKLIREERRKRGLPVDKATPQEMKSIHSLGSGFTIGSRLRGETRFSALWHLRY